MSRQRILLSLFDGTGSICTPFLAQGEDWRVVRLDVDGRHGADIVRDILAWDPARDWTGPPPDVIFAGPPCEQYSTARSTAKSQRNLKLADSLVSKTLDVIAHFQGSNPCLQYFVENPDTSMMWKRWVSRRMYRDSMLHAKDAQASVVARARDKGKVLRVGQIRTRVMSESRSDAHIVRLDYCQFGARYRKRTRFMTNNPFPGTLCSGQCGSMSNGRHMEVAQRGPRSRTSGGGSHTLDQLHAYPAGLVTEIYNHIACSSSTEQRDLVPGFTCEPVWDPDTLLTQDWPVIVCTV